MVIKKGPVAIAAVAVVLAVSPLVWLVGREPEPGPETQIQQLVEESIEDVEEGEVGDLLDRVSASYRGEGGDRDQLRSYLTALVFRGDVDVKLLSHQIAVTGETARAELEVVLIRGGLSGAVEGDVGARTVILDLVREDDEWKVTGSEVAGSKVN